MSTGNDMYTAILKEIGAEESSMGYLFDESDDEDIRGDDHEGDGNELVRDYTRRDTSTQQLNGHTSTRDFVSNDDHLLHKWESEAEDNVVDDPNKIKRDADDDKTFTENSVYGNGSIHVSSGKKSNVHQQTAWKQMLEVSSAKQEQIMGQMINLQKAQKESSPRNKIKRLTINSEKSPYENGAVMPAPSHVVLKEINDNNPSLNLSTVSSSTIHQISTRNAKLKGQWQSQQEKSTKLQDKLTVMQTKFYDQQEQWEKEQQELFSPTHSPTKIPKWRSSTMMTNNTDAEKTTFYEMVGNKIDRTSPKKPKLLSENSPSQELESSKALILQLKSQLEESQKFQQSQHDELSDCKDRLKKSDVEHQAFLFRYEMEKKSWQNEIKEKQAQYHEELQSLDADLEGTRQKLLQQIAVNQDLRENRHDESKQPSSNTDVLKEELRLMQNQMKSEMEENREQSAYIQRLKDENHRLKTDFTGKKELERTQDEIKSQMKVAIEEQTKKTREFQSQIRELEGRHAEELEYWKVEVEGHRQQIELNSTRMESQLEDANIRYAKLERKHDKEVKEWQLLLDADITKAVADESEYEDLESEKNLIVIGAGNKSAESLSPIRKVPSIHPRQSNDDCDENTNKNSNYNHSSDDDSKRIPSESMNMIDDLLQELGEMDLERTAILKEINDDDNVDIGSVCTENKSEDSFSNINSSFTVEMPTNRTARPKTERETEKDYYGAASDIVEEIPKTLESPDNSWNHAERRNVDVSDATNESEVLDETLHLLNNLKSMLTSHENGSEHESTVIERLEVLSELMQSQDQSHSKSTPSNPRILEIHSGHNVSSGSAGDDTSFAISASQGNANQASWISKVKATAIADPWPALVAELKNRCEFLERDRDEVTRITEQILEMERASHKVELEAAVATIERKANENLYRIQLESNQEMKTFYQNICFQCEQEAFDYSNSRE